MLVCANCNRGMRPKKNGTSFIEMAQDRPYKLWMADLWECQDCGAQVLHTAPTQKPISESHMDNFALSINTYQPKYQAKEWNRA
jgi:hypothetical protein